MVFLCSFHFIYIYISININLNNIKTLYERVKISSQELFLINKT